MEPSFEVVDTYIGRIGMYNILEDIKNG